uniref:Si:dkey-226l10.6 n=1 Tax=Sinocyclocheilus rhinocerous TaxID=307959 RepID=A0A673I0T8_9TELE
ISEAVSLACVKEEPLEYELSTNMTSGQEQNSSLDESVKYEESELSVTEDGTSTKFLKMGLLLRHRVIHTKENPEGRFVCQQCGKGFPHQAFLKAHQKVHEDAESTMPFTCHLCPRRFGYKVALVAHMKHHSSKLTCICPICEKSYQYRGSLIQHLKSSHAGEKLLCKTCDKGFLRVNGYVKHMDKHNVMTPFYCDICKIYFSQRGYTAHMATHEQKSLSEQQPDESVENQPNDTEISLVSVNSSEEGMDPVTVRQEEDEMELLSEDEMEVLSGNSVDPSTVEGVESENVVVEKELPQDNHEEEKKIQFLGTLSTTAWILCSEQLIKRKNSTSNYILLYCFLQTHSFSFHKTLIDGLESFCGLL